MKYKKEEQLIFEDNKVRINNNYIQEAAEQLAADINNNIDFIVVKTLGTETLIRLRDKINEELNNRETEDK